MTSVKKLWVYGLFLALAMTGCATAPEKPPERIQGVFFPDPPALPRIQYLRSYTSSKDIETGSSKFEKFVTGEEEKIKRLDKPFGVGIYNGKIYVCDTNHSVMVFDLKQKKFQTIEGASGMGKPLQPLNMVIDENGTKYVADPVRGQVLVYDANDFFVRPIGSPVEWTPIDVTYFEDKLYVVDKSINEIWVLDKKTGERIDKIGKKGEDAAQWLARPTNLTFASDGILYVADAGRFQVIKFDRDGHFLGTIGELGTGPAHFARPRGVATDRDRRLYAVDAAFDNIQMFSPDGRLLMYFGKAGNGPGDFFLPAAVTIDYDNIQYFSEYIDPNFEAEALILVTNQFGSRLVNVFALGKQKGVKYPTDKELLDQLEEMKRQREEEQKKLEQKQEGKEEDKKGEEEEK